MCSHWEAFTTLSLLRSFWPFPSLIWVNICTFPLTSPHRSCPKHQKRKKRCLSITCSIERRFASSCNESNRWKVSHGNMKLKLYCLVDWDWMCMHQSCWKVILRWSVISDETGVYCMLHHSRDAVGTFFLLSWVLRTADTSLRTVSV